MNSTTKGLFGLVLWLAAGFALTEFVTLSLTAWLQHQAPSTETAPRTVATATKQ